MDISKIKAKDTAWVSDLHADHYNAIAYDRRPWSTVEEGWTILRDNWRRVVKPHMTVFCLGDMFMSTDKDVIADMLRELTGHIKLVPGNHDETLVQMLSGQLMPGSPGGVMYWQGGSIELLPPLLELRGAGWALPMVLCHYAMESWHKSHKGVWHLHGHTHPTFEHIGEDFDFTEDVLRYKLNPLGLHPHRLNLCMGILHAGLPARAWAPQTWRQLIERMRFNDQQVAAAVMNDHISENGVWRYDEEWLNERFAEVRAALPDSLYDDPDR